MDTLRRPAERAPSLGRAPVRLARRLAGGRGTTPGQLRAVRAVLVLVCLVGASVGAYGAQARVDATTEIRRRAGPLSVAAIDVYRSLAAADATVAGEFLLPHGPGPISAPKAYEDEVERAATSLARASRLVSEDGLTAVRIASITSQLPVYTELVGQALALGVVDGREVLGRASALMQSTILRRAEALQRSQSRNLDAEYQRAGSLPVAALASCVLVLLALAGAQLFLFRRTRRVFNLGLVGSSALVIAALLWSVVSLSGSHNHLESARRHSGSVTDALGLARIAAFQARANEVLALVVTGDEAPYDAGFSVKTRFLVRQDGKGDLGGAIGAALRLADGTPGQARVEPAVGATGAWIQADERMRGLRDRGRKSEAVDSAINRGGEAGLAFSRLETILDGAVAGEDVAFGKDIGRAGDALRGLVLGTVLLALAAAAAAVWGIGQRLEEYR